MNGEVGSYIQAAALGSTMARNHLREVFGNDFQTPAGWSSMLAHMPGSRVGNMLDRRGAWWTRECFQALFVACWIHHPVEKGAFMINLSGNHFDNVQDAYNSLIASGAMTTRMSSHLSKRGASAHEGWDFLKGYGELLVQIEGVKDVNSALFLKCEGHALESGLSLSTVKHMASWVKKSVTGSGQTASQALNDWAGYSSVVEGRAAENFSKSYEKLLGQLGLKSRSTTVEEMMEAMVRKLGIPSLPPHLKDNTHALGHAMLGSRGYIAVFKSQRAELKKKGVDFDETAEKELNGIAERMTATASPQSAQHYNEIRVTPAEVDISLAKFRSYVV
jgi:hypothetical protein